MRTSDLCRTMVFALISAFAIIACKPTGDPTPGRFHVHSGNFTQSTFGRRGNYELVVPQGSWVTHYWRNNDDASNQFWNNGATIPKIQSVRPIPAPTDVELTERTLLFPSNPSNLQAILRIGDSLFHSSFEGLQWSEPVEVKVNGQKLTGVTGHPGFIQNSAGEYELLVPQGDGLNHYFRAGAIGDHPWVVRSTVPGLDAPPGLQPVPIDVALIQDTSGNDAAIVRMRPAREQGDFLAFYSFDRASGRWSAPSAVFADEQQIVGVTGKPGLIQSTFGRNGNFELVVPQGNDLVHYFRDNNAPELKWHKSGSPMPPVFGGDVPPGLSPIPIAVSMLQNNSDSAGKLEVIARMKPTRTGQGEGDFLAYYWFDINSRIWRVQSEITVGGKPITGITGF
jgi:hypothetical protein